MDAQNPFRTSWVWVKIKPQKKAGFSLAFPFTRGPFGVPKFDPQLEGGLSPIFVGLHIPGAARIWSEPSPTSGRGTTDAAAVHQHQEVSPGHAAWRTCSLGEHRFCSGNPAGCFKGKPNGNAQSGASPLFWYMPMICKPFLSEIQKKKHPGPCLWLSSLTLCSSMPPSRQSPCNEKLGGSRIRDIGLASRALHGPIGALAFGCVST